MPTARKQTYHQRQERHAISTTANADTWHRSTIKIKDTGLYRVRLKV
uniref:Uncharacterized protein n=1 Tax=Arundo donax TaxID=35708 RepID=A0A0A9FBZ1_ARUDO